MIVCKQCNKLHNNKTFCSRNCKNKWQSINLKGKNNPNYGNRVTPELRELISRRTTEAMKNVHLSWKNSPLYEERLQKLQDGRDRYFRINGHPHKGKTIEEIYGVEKALKLRKRNRETTILQLKSGKMPNKQTGIELIFKKALLDNNIGFREQESFKLGIADFYLPEYNAFVFCDGDYWHNYPYGKSRDSNQVKYLKSIGFNAYRFWGREIRNDVMGCLKRM